MNKIEKCYGDMGLEFNESEIDLAHSVGKPTIDKNSKKKYQFLQSSNCENQEWPSVKRYDERKKKP